jgi:ABC-type transport system involved in multi-copper enzyme maturation permease subunit
MSTETTQTPVRKDGELSPPLRTLMRGIYLVTLFLTSFRKSRKSQVLAILGLLPVVVMVAWDVPSPARFFFRDFVQTLYISLLIPLSGLLLGTAALSDEIESHTIVQLVTRPVRRIEILIWRYIATVIAGIIISIIVTSGFYISVVISDEIPIEMLTGFWSVCAVCNAVYCARFMLLGIALKRPLVWGVVITLYEQLLGVVAIFFEGVVFSLSGHILNYGQLFVDYSYSIPGWPPLNSGWALVVIVIVCISLSAIMFRAKDLA